MFIYSLTHPSSDKIYIGKTNKPQRRLREHIRRKGKAKLGVWMGSLRDSGLKPVMAILEEVSEASWAGAERRLIAHYRQFYGDDRVLNETEGGENPPDNHTPTWREHMSEIMTGRKHSEESKRIMSIAKKGKKTGPFTEAHKEAIRQSKLGKKTGPSPLRGTKLSEETRRKISLSLTGKKPSDSTKQKLSVAHSGSKNAFYNKKHSAETRAKMSAFRKTYTHSRETYLKIGIANRKIKNQDDIGEIKKLSSQGLSFRKIAKRFNVTNQTIARIVRS
jgi:hypothetical protein